ncbi:MAG: hypothetical protein CM15mP74_05690 [Halieaceae bacterium]|nr:MAG: hypothetical protein CM15mP74_05690 [Halieaceae bacterium]
MIGQTFSIPSGSIGDSTIDMFLNFTPALERESIFPVTGHRATCSSVEYQSDPDPAPPISQYPSSICKRLPARWKLSGSAGRSASAFIAEIEVGIDITHTDPVDLLVTLKNPEDIAVILWDQSSPNSENLIGTFPTTLSPEESLSILARERMGGVWKLVVEDVGQGPIIREER